MIGVGRGTTAGARIDRDPAVHCDGHARLRRMFNPSFFCRYFDNGHRAFLAFSLIAERLLAGDNGNLRRHHDSKIVHTLRTAPSQPVGQWLLA